MTTALWIGLGGFLGANARYWLALWAADRWGTAFPFGTLMVNGLGSFGLALFLTVATGRFIISPGARLFVVVGFLGGFTTFSAFSLETIGLLGQNRWGPALLNVVTNNGLSLLGAVLGIALARWLQKGG